MVPPAPRRPGDPRLVRLDVDWAEFLGRHDLLWDRMPRDYFEGAFAGNGLMGTIVHQDDIEPNTLRFEIGRTDVYDHRENFEDWRESLHGRVRLPIGQILLRPAGTIRKVTLRMDLWNAEIRGELLTDSGILVFRCFVPSLEEYIVLDLECSGGEERATVRFRPQQGDSPRFTVEPERDKGYAYVPNPPLQIKRVGEVETFTQPLLAGSDYATAWTCRERGRGKRTVFVAVANRRAQGLSPANGSAEDAARVIHAALDADPVCVEAAHRGWWHSFYPASFLSLPDARLEGFYWIQLHKLASATRGDRPVVDLMGPWFKPTVWAAYWQNLNTQLNYYITNPSNHVEIGEALCRLLERRADQLAANVPAEMQHDCAALGNPTGFDDLRARVVDTVPRDPEQSHHFIALPWMMHQFYLHYRHTMDDRRLRETLYPLLKRTFNIYLRTMVGGPDGRLHIPLAYSDEYGSAEDTSMNLALARWGFETLIDCAGRLGIDDPLLPCWRDALDRLVDYPCDPETGIMIGAATPFAKPHRHSSHLFCVFPFHVLDADRHPARLAVVRRSLRHFTALDGDNCMFKFTGASSLWASIGEGEEALKWLARALAHVPGGAPTIGANTLYSETGWQTFESPISAARNLLDMVLQSWGGVIRVFPACPASWGDVRFHDLRAEGAFLVSARREAGRTKWVGIKSLAGEPCRLRCHFDELPGVKGPPGCVLMRRDRPDEFELSLGRGEEAVVYSGSAPSGFVLSPLTEQASPANRWGINEGVPGRDARNR
jgi:alpha-L-fucosidase 2